MNLTLNEDTVQIQLTPSERLWACHVSAQIELSLASIQSIRLERPDTPWWTSMRAPGTHLPGLFKAGTYYTERGREFWYVHETQPCLCLDLLAGYYRRIVLTSAEVNEWLALIESSWQAALTV